MMQPKRTKFRKQFKGKISGSAQRGNTVAFGEFGLKATDRCRMTAREIEAARQSCSRAALDALQLARDRIEAFHRRQRPQEAGPARAT